MGNCLHAEIALWYEGMDLAIFIFSWFKRSMNANFMLLSYKNQRKIYLKFITRVYQCWQKRAYYEKSMLFIGVDH
jgi:hypothetical protein